LILRLAVLLCLLLSGVAAHAECSTGRVTLRGDWGQAGFDVSIADNDQSRSRGLMHVESLPKFSGMLFVFDQPHHARFWMRNTLIPLDMLFIGEDGVIRSIHPNAVPLDETSIDGGSDVLAVLEVNGGMAARLGVTKGDQVQHPAFGGDAAWPCN